MCLYKKFRCATHNIFNSDFNKEILEEVIIWHDLSFNPNDLPKESGDYLIAYERDVYFDYFEVDDDEREHDGECWENHWKKDIVAWAEMPKFKTKSNYE